MPTLSLQGFPIYGSIRDAPPGWRWPGVVVVCLFLFACAPKLAPPPPTWPSVVTTEDQVAFYVSGLKLPGTRQELRAREGGANLWIPLALIHTLRFTGPAQDQYRPAEIVLTSGELLTLDISIRQILEGQTDLGYWNIPLSQVSRLEMGTE